MRFNSATTIEQYVTERTPKNITIGSCTPAILLMVLRVVKTTVLPLSV
jgi:hypothetical protein